MNKENVEEYLKGVSKPILPASPQQEILKITLLNARRSSRIGLLLVALPAIVILLFIIKNLFHLNPGFTELIDKSASGLSIHTKAFLFFIFLVGFPMIAIVMNLLSIMYFQYDKEKMEFNITIKIRWWNIIITLLGAALACFYILHLLADSLLGGG
jgi:hypothetical protein